MSTSTSTTSSRPAAACPTCSTLLLTPDWSESAGTDKTLHLWHCPMCGSDFQTVDEDTCAHVSDADAMREFWPTLLVA
jgi:Zn finger protein HypA/HybF involved in hydrogenase expression